MTKYFIYSFISLFLLSFSNGFSAENLSSKPNACLTLGKTGSVGGVPGKKGWKLNPPCCKGLVDRESLDICGKGAGGGYVYVCTQCGDGKCDTRYESECNCPSDCAQPKK